MQDDKHVASLYTEANSRKQLWKEAIKWPLYSVAVMPVVLAAGWKLSREESIPLENLIGFLIASVFLLLWENLTNDLFDADTGIDAVNKPHSVVALMGGKQPVRRLAYLALFIGLSIIIWLALNSNLEVLFLVLGSCLLGYLYQGPPFRLGYQGLGEPLCWLAFGPLATAAALSALSTSEGGFDINLGTATLLGAGPALATTLVLFCSHFHQITEDAAHGKRSPLVLLGTRRASKVIPWLVGITFSLEWIPIFFGNWPPSSFLGIIGLPPAIKLIHLVNHHHNNPKLISKSKFLALRFQALNGLGLSLGLASAPLIGIN